MKAGLRTGGVRVLGEDLGMANPGSECEAECPKEERAERRTRHGSCPRVSLLFPTPSPWSHTPDQDLPQGLPGLLLSGEVDPEALLRAQAVERRVWGSRKPRLQSPRHQGVQEGRGLGPWDKSRWKPQRVRPQETPQLIL